MKRWKRVCKSCMAFYPMITLVITTISTGSLVMAADSNQIQLFRAISNSNMAAVESYIKDGQSLAIVNQMNMSPLLAALNNKRKEIAVLLIENGADVNFARKPSGETPLFYAAGHGFTEIVDLLLKKGAHIEAQDRYGWTPLMAAVFDGRTDTVNLLLKNNADPNHIDTSGISMLMYAAQNGYPRIVEQLLAKGADPSVKDKNSKTAIQYAAEKSHADIVKLLTSRLSEK